MTDLKLFIDPNDAGFPSTVRELLNDYEYKADFDEKRKARTNISATVTTLGKCILICNNHIYIWSCLASESGIPHGIHMELPATGLKYSTDLVCLFSKGQNRKSASLLAISPEGYLRYWAELGKQPKNEECLLNNEVAHSIQLIDSQEHVHRFLLTTTTGSFHTIDLYGPNQADRLAARPIDVGGPGGGIGRRMSLLLFGSLTAEKELIQKTLFVRDSMRCSADVLNVLGRYLRFYSIVEQKGQNFEVDIGDLALSKYNKGKEKSERRQFRIIDAILYKIGILLFLVGEKEYSEVSGRSLQIDRKLFLAYYEEPNPKEAPAQRTLRSLINIELPERLQTIGLEKRLKTTKLMSAGQDECYIAFYDSFYLVRHPNNPTTISTYLLDNYQTEKVQLSQQSSPMMRNFDGDILLGAAAVHGFCHLILKESGICVVRRLPQHYDLQFWKKYRTILNNLDDAQEGLTEHRLKDAFIDFCAKDIKEAKNVLRDLLKNVENRVEEGRNNEERTGEEDLGSETGGQIQNKQQGSLADIVTDLLLYFVDRQPTVQEDPRWTFSPETPISHDQKDELRHLAEIKKFELIQKQLKIKTAFYKMFVLFLRTFNLVEWIDYPVQTFQMRSGKAVVAEFGEKLVAMTATFNWLSEHSNSLPLVNRALSELAKQHVTHYGLPKANPYLSPTDYVFNKVSAFHELVSALVQVGEQAMEEDGGGNANQAKAKIINEVGSLLLTVIEGVYDAHHEEWAMHSPQNDHSTWLNQPDFLTHFVTHLNTALEYLSSIQAPSTSTNEAMHHQMEVILAQCFRLADFVLSQQSTNQINDSKIIARFSALGHQDMALELAEKHKDFTFLVAYCHTRLDEPHQAAAISRYKETYGNDFFNFLYTWYQQKGMFNHLLAERGQKANDFLEERQEINWIRQIQEGKFLQARKTLKKMADKEEDENKKLVELSLCKMAALCEDQENVAEIAELSEQIRAIHEKRRATQQQMDEE